MVKPQFEVGRDRLGSGGVVRSAELRAGAVRTVAGQAAELGLGALGVTASPLPGPSGNVEYFLWLRAGAPKSTRPMSSTLWRRARNDDSRATRRTVFLLAHTGRPAAVRSAELVVQGLLRNDIGVRVLEAEATDLPLPEPVHKVPATTDARRGLRTDRGARR